MKKNLVRGIFASALLVSGSFSMAGDFDGSKTLICAPVVVMDCTLEADCAKGTPAEMGAPAFVRIDFEKKLVVGPKRITPVLQLEKAEDQILMQGNELGFAWTIALSKASGNMTTTMVNQDGAFVMFGACTPL